MNQLIKKAENLPVGAIATTVGLATLSNVYAGMGFTWIRHITMISAMFIWLAAAVKMTVHFTAFKKDYSQVVPGSLYATFTMLTMILGSYLFGFHETLGRGIWLGGLLLHMLHILIFTYRNVLKGIGKETFIPSWFVTYAGILVAVTVGTEKEMPLLLTGLVYYSFAMATVLFPCMIYRLIKRPLPPQFRLTAAILLAPTSLIFVGYLNVSEQPIPAVVFSLYAMVFGVIIYIVTKLPQFLSIKFNPGFAALTFPLAIGQVATNRMSGFLLNNGWDTLGEIIREFSGIQLYITTAIIAFVAFNFVKMFVLSFQMQPEAVSTKD